MYFRAFQNFDWNFWPCFFCVACCLILLQHGTRHIIESMNKAGHSIDTLFLCGGLTKNELFIQTHADVTGLWILLYCCSCSRRKGEEKLFLANQCQSTWRVSDLYYPIENQDDVMLLSNLWRMVFVCTTQKCPFILNRNDWLGAGLWFVGFVFYFLQLSITCDLQIKLPRWKVKFWWMSIIFGSFSRA